MLLLMVLVMRLLHHGMTLTSPHATAPTIHHRRSASTGMEVAAAVDATPRPRNVLALGSVGPVRLKGHWQGRQTRQHGGEQMPAVGVDPVYK